MKDFRKHTDVRIDLGAGRDSKLKRVALDDLAFGKPNRPSTPINGVISNFYGDNATQEITEKYHLQYELVLYLPFI